MNMEEKLTGQASDDLVKALGSVVLNFSYLETILSLNVWILIDMSDANIGKIVTGGKPFSALIDMFDALYRHRIIDVIQAEGKSTKVPSKTLTDLVKKLVEANEQRNQVIHSAWVSNTKDPETHSRFKFTAKRSKGLERVSKNMSVQDVLQIAHAISEVADQFLELSERLYSPIFFLLHWKNWMVTLEEWGAPGDIERWIEWANNLSKSAQTNGAEG